MTQNNVFSSKSFGDWTSGEYKRTCFFNFGNATKDWKKTREQYLQDKFFLFWKVLIMYLNLTHKVLLSSMSGNSVANLKFSYDILSNCLWFQAKRTAIWNVVTSTSNRPTALEKVICQYIINHNKIYKFSFSFPTDSKEVLPTSSSLLTKIFVM